MTKQEAQTVLNEMPEKFIVGNLIERLFILEGIDKGLKDIEEGRVHSHEDIKKMVES